MIFDRHTFRYPRTLREAKRDPYDWFEYDAEAARRRERAKTLRAMAVLVAVLLFVSWVAYL